MAFADETTTLDTPDDMYCKLPQDSPLGVRGVRNIPCMGQPGKRAPTVEICDSAEPYRPIVMRQHTLGPYPFDPNLISQGIPPDGRVPGQVELHIFAPVEGTPPPAGLPHDEAGAPVIPTPPFVLKAGGTNRSAEARIGASDTPIRARFAHAETGDLPGSLRLPGGNPPLTAPRSQSPRRPANGRYLAQTEPPTSSRTSSIPRPRGKTSFSPGHLRQG